MSGLVHRVVVWWLFDHSPKRFQDWAESWARTLVFRRSPTYKAGLEWARDAQAPGETMTVDELRREGGRGINPRGPRR